MTFAAQQLLPYALPVIIAWALYRRVRRSFGPQAWKPVRAWLRIGLMALLALGLTIVAALLPQALAPMAAGAALGVALGWIGLRRTHAEWRDGTRTYIPNPWVGGILTLALVVRMAWRFGHGGGIRAAQQQPSVLTLAIAAALVGYSLYYGIGLVHRMRTLGERSPGD